MGYCRPRQLYLGGVQGVFLYKSLDKLLWSNVTQMLLLNKHKSNTVIDLNKRCVHTYMKLISFKSEN